MQCVGRTHGEGTAKMGTIEKTKKASLLEGKNFQGKEIENRGSLLYVEEAEARKKK